MINRVTSLISKTATVGPQTAGRKRGLKGWFFGITLLFGLLVVGCSQGTYPLDIFYEQHYQQSYRSHEPPRMNGVADAVAFYPGTTSSVTDTGAELYQVNCQMCHGADAKGTGPVLNIMRDSYAYTPIVDPNLTTRPSALIAARLEATARPLGPTSVMPPFGKLLSAEERTSIAQYISSLPK
ncbi:MAG: cytochrome c [SAR202 cluster bacterium]|nr:cytochrome c [SAR202 cluster bacterium]